MTSTPLATEAAPDVRDLDASAVLDAVVHERRAADAAEARLLALAVHWVDLHPATPGTRPRPSRPSGPVGWRRRWVRRSSPRHRWPVAAPSVAEYAVEELAAALGLSHLAGLPLVSEVVELRHRLPRLWALVQDG